MEYRHPSSSIALPNDRSAIRRRSGAFSPDPNSNHGGLRSASSSIKVPHLTVQVEDVDGPDSRPTVLLVHKEKVLPRLPPRSPALPFHHRNGIDMPGPSSLGCFYSSQHLAARTPELVEDDLPVVMPFSLVPLTPCPAVQPADHRDAPSGSVETTDTTASPDSQLPTVPFSSERDSLRRPCNHRAGSDASSQYSQCSSESGSECTSACSKYSASSSRSQRAAALSASLGTVDKLTLKFPISRSVKKLSSVGRGVDRGGGFLAMPVEKNGLGMGRVDRWTVYKWCLFFSICSIFVYGTAGLVCALLTWFKNWTHADVMYVADYDVLVLITLASAILLLTSLIGMTGTILNSRPILAVYAILLWPALISILAIGYTSYKRYAFSLDRKLNLAWSQWYTPFGRLIIQDSLRCCGYYSPLHEATASARCYARSMLPGCKGKLLSFERNNLGLVWATAFALVPMHIINIFVSLLCANHVTRTFGKGIVPKQYRLSRADLQANAERIMGKFRDGGVVRPALSRAPLSGGFRDDKESISPVYRHPSVLRPGLVKTGRRSRG